jgi:hypothetical protein|tara:strand:- start:5418 stop:5687 length:270 start_codon:yes stop_codon:yes gene_type:complete
MSLENIENDVFGYLLNRKVSDYEKKYIDTLEKMEELIDDIITKKYTINLLDKEKLINIDNRWINNKYKSLLKLQINTDLITDDIISLME